MAVWGRNPHTDWLVPLLERADLKVKYWVDTNFREEQPVSWKEKVKHLVKYPAKKLLSKGKTTILLNHCDCLPRVDAIIVTDYVQFASVRNTIPEIAKTIIPITELAD